MLEKVICQKCLDSSHVWKPFSYFLRSAHTPKRPRTAGSKILITQHRFEVPLPEETPAYVSKTVSQEPAPRTQTPHKFHVVRRLDRRVVWQERRILNDLGLLGPVGVTKILLNIPSINKDLWKVKHAVSIEPLKIEGEIPDSVESFKGGLLSPNGIYTFFERENAATDTPSFRAEKTMPRKSRHPYKLAKFNYQPFYYNYREDS